MGDVACVRQVTDDGARMTHDRLPTSLLYAMMGLMSPLIHHIPDGLFVVVSSWLSLSLLVRAPTTGGRRCLLGLRGCWRCMV